MVLDAVVVVVVVVFFVVFFVVVVFVVFFFFHLNKVKIKLREWGVQHINKPLWAKVSKKQTLNKKKTFSYRVYELVQVVASRYAYYKVHSYPFSSHFDVRVIP